MQITETNPQVSQSKAVYVLHNLSYLDFNVVFNGSAVFSSSGIIFSTA